MRLMVTVVIPKNQHISEQCQKIFTLPVLLTRMHHTPAITCLCCHFMLCDRWSNEVCVAVCIVALASLHWSSGF